MASCEVSYAMPFTNVDDLWETIEECYAQVTYSQLLNMQKEMSDHWNYCVVAKGGTFEHQLKSIFSCSLFPNFLFEV